MLAGDQEEYRVLMERHLPVILRMTLRVTGNLEDAEEAAQEAFLLAFKKLATFREDAAFGTWVYRIAMNCSLNLMKRRARSVEWNAEPLDDAFESQQAVSSRPTPEAALLDAEANLQRERAMRSLTPRERTAFVLRHLEEQPVDVIADALGISANTARQVVFRAICKLRVKLAPSRTSLGSPVPSSRFLKDTQ